MKTCIRGGTILTEEAEWIGDILLEDHQIKAIAPHIEEAADVIVDASGKYVLAGGIDEHAHFGSFHSMSFETCAAAAAGGTTTVMDFVTQLPGQSLQDALSSQISLAKQHPYVNIGFHSMLMDVREETLSEIKALPAYGITSLKMFMAYKGTPYHASREHILSAMMLAKQAGITMMLHAEDADLIEQHTDQLLSQGITAPYAHALAHPAASEIAAVQDAIELVRQTGASLFLVHISTGEALRLIHEASLEGLPIACETCTHYLVLQADALHEAGLRGCRYLCSPPLRTRADREALWEGIRQGWIEAVSSDHCAVIGGYAAKIKQYTNFSKVFNGMPGVQNRLHLLWTKGVCEGRISKQQLVKIFSAGPADRCQLSHKGRLLPGFDADIVLYDPKPKRIWRDEDSLEGIDYAGYAGVELHGMVEKVWINGQLCVEHEVPNYRHAGKLQLSG